jgi:hypothetical protein
MNGENDLKWHSEQTNRSTQAAANEIPQMRCVFSFAKRGCVADQPQF